MSCLLVRLRQSWIDRGKCRSSRHPLRFRRASYARWSRTELNPVNVSTWSEVWNENLLDRPVSLFWVPSFAQQWNTCASSKPSSNRLVLSFWSIKRSCCLEGPNVPWQQIELQVQQRSPRELTWASWRTLLLLRQWTANRHGTRARCCIQFQVHGNCRLMIS